MTSQLATLIGCVAIALWSSLAVLTTASGNLPPFQLLALSFAIGGGIGLALLLRPRGPGLRALRQPPAAFALACLALFGYHALYFVALKTAPAVEANLINYLWPLLIVLFAALLPGERVRAGQVFGTLLGLVGAALIVSRGESLTVQAAHVPGYLAALAAALVWSGYSVLNRRYSTVPSAAIAGPCLIVAALGATAHLVFEQTVALSAAQWLIVLAMGLGPVGIAFWCWDIGCKRGELALLGTLAYAAPLLSTAWLLLADRASVHWTHAVACALIVLGGLLSLQATPNTNERSRAHAPPDSTVPKARIG